MRPNIKILYKRLLNNKIHSIYIKEQDKFIIVSLFYHIWGDSMHRIDYALERNKK